MNYYLGIYTACLFIFLARSDKNLRIFDNEIILFMVGIILIFLAGFRYNISTDYWNYYRLFMSNDANRLEFGFNSLMNISKFIYGNNFNFFIFNIALLSITTKLLYFKKLEIPFFALFIYICLYYLNFEFNIIRQGLGAGFIFFAVDYGKKKKFKYYLLFVLIAASFHISYILFIILYPLCSYNYNLSFKKFFLIIICIIILRITLIPIILKFTRSIFSRTNNFILIQICHYLGVGSFSINSAIIRRIVIIMFYFYFFGYKNLNVNFSLYFCSLLCSILLSGNQIFAHRLSLIFDIFLIPLFGNNKIKFTWKNWFGLAAFAFLLIILYIIPMRPVLPYQSYL